MFEDRPINPDKKYLQEQQAKYKQQQLALGKEYLHKGHSPMIPCHKQSFTQQKSAKKSSEKQKKQSKAQIYQRIKKNNREKFGEWDNHKYKEQAQQKPKKLDPKLMTVNYKPKKVNIDTREYKKPGYVQDSSWKAKKNELQEKMEYKKMIDYMKRLYNEFEVEKEKFEKEKDYLKFKKAIQNVQGITIESKLKTKHDMGSQNKFRQSMPNLLEKSPSNKKQISINYKLPNSDTINVEENCDQTIEKEQVQNDPSKVKQFQYSISKLHQCHPFNLRQIYNYVNKEEFIAENCQLYQKAKYIIQNQRSTAKVKTIKAKCTHGSIGANHATCLEEQCAEKRVTKFADNWYELWIAGRYRTIYNKELGYKVVWYGNGDIKQEFHGGKIQTYESKAKKAVEIKVENHLPFWYFPAINQLETKDEKGNNEVIFADGRHEIIMSQENL